MKRPNDLAELLIDMSGWYAELALLEWLVDTGLVSILADRPSTLADISTWLDYPAERVAPLLDGLSGLGFVDLTADGYVVPNAMAERLVPGGNGYLGDSVRHHARYWRAWANLPELLALRSTPEDWMLDRAIHDDPDNHTLLLRSSASETTVGERTALLRRILTPMARSLVDIGGGHGKLSQQASVSLPELRAEAWDVAASEPIWSALAACLPSTVRARVSFHPCDLLAESTWSVERPDVDICVISHVLANYDIDTVTALLGNAFRVFANSTIYLVTSWRPFGDARDPLPSLLFDVLIQSATLAGAAHPNDQIEAAIRDAGGAVLSLVEVDGSALWQSRRA